MMITTEGIIIQLRMEDISTLGRNTSGVKMMNVDKDVWTAEAADIEKFFADTFGDKLSAELYDSLKTLKGKLN